MNRMVCEQEKCVQMLKASADAPPASEEVSRAGGPRILDTRLAEILGLDEHEDIRRLIAKHQSSLRQLGDIAFQEMPGDATVLGAYLNTRQAAFVTAKCDTPKAVEITLNMVRTFAP